MKYGFAVLESQVTNTQNSVERVILEPKQII